MVQEPAPPPFACQDPTKLAALFCAVVEPENAVVMTNAKKGAHVSPLESCLDYADCRFGKDREAHQRRCWEEWLTAVCDHRPRR